MKSFTNRCLSYHRFREVLHISRPRGNQPIYCLARLQQATTTFNLPVQAVSTNNLHPGDHLSGKKWTVDVTTLGAAAHRVDSSGLQAAPSSFPRVLTYLLPP